MVLSVFGRFGLHDSPPNAVIFLWIFGYLVQFGVFFWAMGISGQMKITAWFVASLLPWVVDWTVPVSAWFLLPEFLLAALVAYWVGSAAGRSESLRQNGVPAVGVVLEVKNPIMNVVINNVYLRRKMRIRVERKDGTPPYEASWKGLFMIGNLPSPGDQFELRVDPANPMHFESAKD